MTPAGLTSSAGRLRALARPATGGSATGQRGVTAIAATSDRKVEFVACGADELALVRCRPGVSRVLPGAPGGDSGSPARGADGSRPHQRPQRIVLDLDDPAHDGQPARQPGVRARRRGPALCVRLQRVGAPPVLPREVLPGPDRRRGPPVLLRAHPPRDGGDLAKAAAARTRSCRRRASRSSCASSSRTASASASSPPVSTRRRGRNWSRRADDGIGDPRTFYDAIITAGFPMRDREPGTLGELSPKPHPWLYAEVCRVGLGIPFEERHLGRRHRGQWRRHLRDSAGGIRGDRDGGRQHRAERHAGALPALLRVVPRGARRHPRLGRTSQ